MRKYRCHICYQNFRPASPKKGAPPRHCSYACAAQEKQDAAVWRVIKEHYFGELGIIPSLDYSIVSMAVKDPSDGYRVESGAVWQRVGKSQWQCLGWCGFPVFSAARQVMLADGEPAPKHAPYFDGYWHCRYPFDEELLAELESWQLASYVAMIRRNFEPNAGLLERDIGFPNDRTSNSLADTKAMNGPTPIADGWPDELIYH